MKVKNNLICLFLAGCLLLGACGRSKLGARDYVAWVENPGNGLKKTIQMGDKEITLQYEPAEYILLKKYRQLPPNYKEELAELRNNDFFTLSIRTATGKLTADQDPQRYQDNYTYFNFSFQQDLFLESGGTRKPCILFHFNNLGEQLGEKAVFALGFAEPEKPEADRTLIIESDKLEIGIVKILISVEDIKKIPTPQNL